VTTSPGKLLERRAVPERARVHGGDKAGHGSAGGVLSAAE
jgi:hypothetical protein